VAPVTSYEYQVFAFNFTGDSDAPSNMIETTTPIAPPPAIELFVAANKNKGSHEPRLIWDPAATEMDVYFNGGSDPIADSVASGWTHVTGSKGGATYTYEVCQVGATTACSGEVSVTY
jgi:hypothetical protein